jgi:hypothetical protein
MEIVRIDSSFNRWDELLALILASFAYMDGIVDPPSSAHRLTLASLARRPRTRSALSRLWMARSSAACS